MSAKQTEWKRVELNKEQIDFSGAVKSDLELDGSSFISLTLKLNSGRVVRIRKADYSIAVEEPSIPTVTKYIAKTRTGLSLTCDTEEAALKAVEGFDGEVEEVKIPVAVENVETIPF